MKRADIIAGVLGIALCFFIFYITTSFPEDQVVRVGPAFFPRLVAAGLGIFSAILLLTAFTRKHLETHSGFSFKDRGVQRGIISFVATVIYCLFFEYLGFITCTIIYLIFLMLLLKDRQYVQLTIISITVTITVFFIFRILLNITLPMGTLYGF
jgi:putative tricarboxylic transport membrane protein